MPLFSGRTISEDDLIDLQGKRAIVTGGNTGVGYATVQFLVRKGAKVYVAARNESKARAAIEQLKSEDIGKGSLERLHLDLSDPRLAKKAAVEYISQEDRLDILVNNAARGANGPYSLDKDGLLDIMVTNHISHYVFTRTLIPLLQQTAAQPGSDVRVVNVSSVAHNRLHPKTLKGKEHINKDYGVGFNGSLDTYGLSKLANILHIAELQRSFKASNTKITCIAVHPGAVKTVGSDAFMNAVPYLTSVAKVVGGLFFGPWRNGAMNVAWAAAGKDIAEDREKYYGVYVEPVAKVGTASPEARDERLAKELQETTEEILKEMGL